LVTREARKAEIATLRQEVNVRLAQLQDEDTKQVETERAELERRLLAPPDISVTATASDRIARDASYRDALERARGAKEGPRLLEMFRDAERFGDSIMAKACMAVALDRGEIPVLDAWLETHPNDEPKLQRLFDLTSAKAITTRSFAVAAVFQSV